MSVATVLALGLLWSIGQSYADTSCINLRGYCQYTSTSCPGNYYTGKCDGPADRQCCIPKSGDNSCTNVGGYCNYQAVSCKNGYQSGMCSGPVDRLCCVLTTSSCSNPETRWAHSTATNELSAYSIGVSSSGGCSDRETPTCTSLDTIRCKCIREIIALKVASGCSVTVTGGTEVGHASGTQSHYNGYKLDISLNSCITSYIQSFNRIANRPSDNAPAYEDASRGIIYYLESNHWDILYQ